MVKRYDIIRETLLIVNSHAQRWYCRTAECGEIYPI
jgi:hypothetical protein